MTSSMRYAFIFILVVSLQSALSTAAVQCPAECRCGTSAGRPTADCSGRNIADLHKLLGSVDPDTSVLDLRSNHITTVPSQSFTGLQNLTVLLLDNNQIAEVEPHAFQGLQRLRVMSLTGNRLTVVRGNAFSELTGDEEVCRGGQLAGNESVECRIDMTKNPLATIERHAFAWIKHLQVFVGESQVPLTIDAYAFYGARWMPQFRVADVPSLTLRPRIFTNTENVELLEVRDISLVENLEKFVFEGLKDVNSIVFARVNIREIQSYAFSGIHFRRTSQVQTSVVNHLPSSPDSNGQMEGNQRREQRKKAIRTARYASSGGSLNFTDCQIGRISTDAFRDANLAYLSIEQSTLDELQPQAFRGVSGLQTLRVVNNKLTSATLREESFASVRGVRLLHLLDNNVDVIERYAFRDVTDVDSLRIHFRSSNVTLMTEAFAHVTDVDELELRGTRLEGGGKTWLNVDVGAFRNLVGVQRMLIADFRSPVLRRHSFVGLSRVGNLTISNCDVTSVEKEAFGDAASHAGAVGLLDMSRGNQLRCECAGQNSAAALQREFDQTFNEYSALCRTESRTGSVGYVDVRQVSAKHLSSECSAAWRSATATPRNWTVVVLVVFTLYQALLRVMHR